MSVALSLIIGTFDKAYGESVSYSAYLFFVFFTAAGVISVSDKEFSYFFILLYIAGAFLKSLIIIHYSCVMMSGVLECGYGDIYNVFTSSRSNTPGIANSLVVFPALAICYIFMKTPIRYSLMALAIVVVLIAFFYLSFLSSRAGYILLIITIIFSLLFGGTRTLIRLLLLFSIVLVLFLFFNGSYDGELFNFEVINKRFTEKGLESQRSERYLAALAELIKTPIGTYRLPYQIGENNLVHNIYLDLAKFGGWVVFVAFVSFSLCGFLFLSFSNDFKSKSISVLFIVTWLALQQDVFYGSGLPVLVVFIMCTTYLIVNSKRSYKFP